MLDILWPSEHVGNHRKCNLNVAGALVNAPNIVIQSRQPPSCTISISRWAHYLHNEISCRCRSKQLFVFKYARNTPRGEKHKLFYNFCLQICKKHSKRRKTQTQALLPLLCSSKRKETQTQSFGVWVLWVTQTRCWLRLLCPVRHSRVSYCYHFCSSTIAQSCVLRLQFLHEHSWTVKC